MPYRHASLPAEAHGLLGHVENVEAVGLVEEVDVEVHVHVELPREPEDDVDVGMGIGVVVGTASDEVRARLESASEERFRARGLENPLLGEGTELEVDGGRILALERTQSLQPLELHDGIDFHVAPHGGGPGLGGGVQHATGPRPDVVHGEVALGRRRDANGLVDRALDRGRALRDERLVEMDV